MGDLQDNGEFVEPNFAKLPKAQQEAMGNVAFGGRGMGCHRRALQRLTDLGLIERFEQQWRDRFGVMTVHYYEMPIHIHVRYCAWLADQYDASEAARG